MLRQSAHAEAVLTLALLITQLYLDNFRLTHGHHVARMTIHLQLTHAAGKRLEILRHVYETTSSFPIGSPCARIFHSFWRVFWRFNHIHRVTQRQAFVGELIWTLHNF